MDEKIKKEAFSGREPEIQSQADFSVALGQAETILTHGPILWGKPSLFSLTCRYVGAEMVDLLLDYALSVDPYCLMFMSRDHFALEKLQYLFPLPRQAEDAHHEILTDTDREKVAQILLDRGIIRTNDLLLLACLHGDEALARYVLPMVKAQTSGSSEDFLAPGFVLEKSPALPCIFHVMERAPLEQVGKMFRALRQCFLGPVPLPNWCYRTLSNKLRPRLCSPEIFNTAFECTTLPKAFTRVDLVKSLIEAHNEAGIRLLLDSGYLKHRNIINNLIQVVRNEYPNELGILSLLIAASPKQDAKRPARLSIDIDPNSIGFLRESWGFRVLPDNSIIITGYKGKDTHVEVPERIGGRVVTAVGKGAFSPAHTRLKDPKRRANLVSVIIPDSVKTLGKNCFDSCTRLEHVRLPHGLTSIPAETFQGTRMLGALKIPDSVTRVECMAFFASGIKSLYLSDSVSVIEADAFSSSSLTQISVPAGALVTTCGGTSSYDGIFWGHFAACANLKTVDLRGKGVAIAENEFLFCTSLSAIRIPDGVTSIGKWAFRGSFLEKIIIPASVQRIGEAAFCQCPVLQEVVFEGTPQMGPEVFMECPMLKDITLPAGMTDLPHATFAGCTNLERVNFPSSLKAIGRCALSGTRISRTDIPATVSSVHPDAWDEYGP